MVPLFGILDMNVRFLFGRARVSAVNLYCSTFWENYIEWIKVDEGGIIVPLLQALVKPLCRINFIGIKLLNYFAVCPNNDQLKLQVFNYKRLLREFDAKVSKE